LSVTVPVDGFAPATDVGESDSPESIAGVTVRVAVAEPPLRVAVRVAPVLVATPEVVTVNVVEEEPAGTVTVKGTDAQVLFEDNDTDTPPDGAVPLRVTVPVDGFPPTTEVGETDRAETVTGWIVNVAVSDVPLRVPVIVAVVVDATVEVLTVNVADVDPAATVTLDGTVALVVLEVSETVAPPVGALPFNVTVPVEGEPPATVAGETDTPERTAAVIVKVAV